MLLGAASEGRPDIVDLLIIAGTEDGTALCEAVKAGSVQCIDLLLKAGADVNFRGIDDKTALFEASKYNSVQCMDLLLKAGAGVNTSDKCGETALFVAASKGSVPLFYAFWNRSVECIDM